LRDPVVVYTEENEAHHLLNSSTSPNCTILNMLMISALQISSDADRFV